MDVCETTKCTVTEGECKALDCATHNYIDDLRRYKNNIFAGEEIIKAVDKQINDLNNFRERIGLERV